MINLRSYISSLCLNVVFIICLLLCTICVDSDAAQQQQVALLLHRVVPQNIFIGANVQQKDEQDLQAVLGGLVNGNPNNNWWDLPRSDGAGQLLKEHLFLNHSPEETLPEVSQEHTRIVANSNTLPLVSAANILQLAQLLLSFLQPQLQIPMQLGAQGQAAAAVGAQQQVQIPIQTLVPALQHAAAAQGQQQAGANLVELVPLQAQQFPILLNATKIMDCVTPVELASLLSLPRQNQIQNSIARLTAVVNETITNILQQAQHNQVNFTVEILANGIRKIKIDLRQQGLQGVVIAQAAPGAAPQNIPAVPRPLIDPRFYNNQGLQRPGLQPANFLNIYLPDRNTQGNQAGRLLRRIPSTVFFSHN